MERTITETSTTVDVIAKENTESSLTVFSQKITDKHCYVLQSPRKCKTKLDLSVKKL